MDPRYQAQVRRVALRIRDHRLQAGYTQLYMAWRMGLSQNAYSKIELCSSRMTVVQLLLIADILIISPESLLTD